MDKPSKIQENKKQKKVDSYKNKKASSTCNGTSKHSYEMKNGEITILEKNDKSSSSVESPDFIPKKIIKRGNEYVIENPNLETKAVNHLLKVIIYSCVKNILNHTKIIKNPFSRIFLCFL